MEDATRQQELIGRETYSPQDKADMKQVLERNNVEQLRTRNFFIQQIRGQLYTAAKEHPQGKTVIS
jgi:hypothetical protein